MNKKLKPIKSESGKMQKWIQTSHTKYVFKKEKHLLTNDLMLFLKKLKKKQTNFWLNLANIASSENKESSLKTNSLCLWFCSHSISLLPQHTFIVKKVIEKYWAQFSVRSNFFDITQFTTLAWNKFFQLRWL